MRRSLALVVSAVMGAGVAAGAVAGPVSGAVVHAPRIVVTRDKGGHGHGGGGGGSGWASSNWSGYAVTGSGLTSVTGTWKVPAVQATSGNTYSSSWIGIDGFNNSSLIQTGTEQDWVNGRATYYAWWEILPAPETQIGSLSVNPGDTVTASIQPASSGTWTITITVGGRSFSTTQSYGGPGTSAEWIEEAPSLGGRVTTLAHYGQATFDPGTVDGRNPGLVASDGGVMVQGRQQVSTPSSPDSDTDGFSVAYGSTAPPAPAS